ncbi:unnamed protein product [Vitrella brassicaformis CCMP3155]|uniref:endo-1,4-beta-xylanase n=2 Tax=Vitrella brassicaformis TaxID=1169539 RepID=A0A0G4EBZ6_VITBC|nr:unnamed protein product [Vitrella brassicaformis CCMP3155]|eukprot:CEL93196.1 unnamed protein product [Vitrella brassicaformis CCMP3155]
MSWLRFLLVLALLFLVLTPEGIDAKKKKGKGKGKKRGGSNFKRLFNKKMVKKGPRGSLRAAAHSKRLYFGAAASAYTNIRKYKKILASQFNMIVATSECKMMRVRSRKGKMNWKWCDDLLRLAKKNGQFFRFHAIAWYLATPRWVEKLPAKKFRAFFISHTKASIKRYAQPRVQSWDVANEALEQIQKNPRKKINWRKSKLYKKFPDHVEVLFRVAKKAAKKKKQPARLFYNDYGAESSRGWSKGKADAIAEICKKGRARGAPIDGVGFQSHFSLDFNDYRGVAANFKRLGKMGVEVQLTEVDVMCGRAVGGRWKKCTKWTPKKAKIQAKIYAGLLRVCLKAPNCSGYITWGVSDKWTWRPADHPFLYDAKFKPKPAFKAVSKVLGARKKKKKGKKGKGKGKGKRRKGKGKGKGKGKKKKGKGKGKGKKGKKGKGKKGKGKKGKGKKGKGKGKGKGKK